MNLTPAVMPEITDDHIANDQGRVRALIVSRLEALWAACAPHLDTRHLEEVGERPDPRMVQIGLSTVRELAKQYRLDRPSTQAEEDVETTDEASVRRLVSAALDQLETARTGL